MKHILLIETLYFILIALPSIFVFLKTRQLYKFSQYKGLRYFSTAFSTLAAGFLVRYIVMLTKITKGSISTIQNFDIFTLIMEFFLVLSGFFLLYTQIWKKFEKEHYKKILSQNEVIIYGLAITIALGDMLLNGFYLMYSSQIIAFSIAAVISLKKYRKRKNNFMQLFFISMVLFLIVWVINLVAQYTIDRFPLMRLYAYLFTVFGCLIISYITLRLTSETNE